MSQAEPEIADESVQRLLLGRLLVKVKKPLSDKAVLACVVKAIEPPLSRAVATTAAQRALEQCLAAGLVTRERGIRLQLSADGLRHISEVLGLKTQRGLAHWDQAQRLVALSMTGRAGAARTALDAERLGADILAAQQGLPADVSVSLKKVVDLMAWRALGVETHKPFSAIAVQRYLLRAIVPEDIRGKPDVWRRMLAMRAIGAQGHEADPLARALLCARVSTPLPVRNDNAGMKSAGQVSLADFAHAVGAAARGPTVRRFHDDRAFIFSVWEHMRGRSPIGEMPLDDFKRRLIAAHQQGLLRIVGADLVAAMDPQDVERSEARLKDATFHFVELTAGGVR